MSEYQEFLNRKVINVKTAGFKVGQDQINPYLFDWQAEIVRPLR